METLEASTENPVAKVRVYAKLEGGSYQRTDRTLVVFISKLREVENPPERISRPYQLN